MGIDLFFTGAGDVNLQKEMNSFIYGAGNEAAKGRPVIYRKMRKDSNGQLIRCECVTKRTDEPDKDTYCPVCLGSKYYWDETYISSYWMPSAPGEKKGNLIFFVGSGIVPDFVDELITVELDSVGKISNPVRRLGIYNIIHVYPYREDNGLLAYWQIHAAPINRRYLGAN